MTTTERLWIRGLRLFGRHGVDEEERQHGQTFWVDAQIELERPNRQDELDSTVNYVEIVKLMQLINQTKSFRLLESFAAALAEGIVEGFSGVRRARVRVRKRPADLAEQLDWVAAEAVYVRRSDVS
jgi:dihydroneopterin aldolase